MTAALIEVGLVVPKAFAYTPTVANAGTGDWAAGSSFTVSVTIAAVGDSVEVMAGWRCQVGAAPFCINSVTSLTSPGVSGGFTELRSVMNTCFGNTTDGQCGGVIGLNWNSEMSAWIGTATSTGNIVITVNLASNGLANGGAIAYDVQFSNGTPSVASLFCAARAAASCQYPIPLATTGSPGQLMIAGITAWSATTGATAACNYNTPTHTQFAAAWLAPVAPAAGAACSFTLTGNSGFETGYAVIDLIFSAASVTVTTVINTSCLGACSGGSNGTSIYLPPPTSTFFNLHFYASQNLATGAQVDNMTIKVAAVHISTNTGILYFCVWGATGVPNAGNLYTLIQPCTAVTLINGTSNFFIHVNPQVNLAASQYYAAGIMTTTTASRGSGASLSGVAIYLTSQAGIIEFKYSVGSATPPNQFFSNTIQTPRDFIFIHSTFAVATVTQTSTTTITGVVSSTVTTTSTSTQVVNQGDPTKPQFWYLPMFYLLFFAAIFLGAYAMINNVGVFRRLGD